MSADMMTRVALLLALGVVCVTADPQVLNPQADELLAKMQDIIHENTENWLPLPSFRLNGSANGYMATVVPFKNIPVYNITRNGNAVTAATAMQIFLTIPFHMNALDAEYDVFSLDNQDGACNFTVEMMSEDNNQFTLHILLNVVDNTCVGKVDSFEINTYWGMALGSVVLCGDQVRDQLIRDLTAAHEIGVRAALNTSLPAFATKAMEGFNFC